MARSARWYMEIADQAFGGMAASTNEQLNAFIEETGGLEDTDFLYLQLARGFDPEPIIAEHIVKRSPYGNPETVEQNLAGSVERGWLEAVEPGSYRLTARGKETAAGIFALADRMFSQIEPLPQADMERLNTLLKRVVSQAMMLPEPRVKWGLSWGKMFDRGPSAHLTVQVRRRMLDLSAFRDDVHIAAWQLYSVDGRQWEAFTYVWRGEAGTAAELAEKLSEYRNYDEEAYAAALQSLAARGWIAEEEGRYTATESGEKLRQQAEDATDRYFDAAWDALSEQEMDEVKALLEKLAEAVKPPEESEEG